MEVKLLRNDPNIVYAFQCGDRSYYQFANMNNIPPLRGLKTLVLYEELRMKTTLEYLEYHIQANDNILSKVKINTTELSKLNDQIKQGLSISLENDFFNTVIKALSDIKKINDQLKERIHIAIDTELMLKVASIIIIDEYEDITDYDFDYNAKKIAYWKKHQGMDFFLNAPIVELFPILKDMPMNLKTYSSIVEQKNAIGLESLLQHLPPDVKQKLRSKYYSSQEEMPLTSKQ